MIKSIENNKKIIISHIADIDGMGSIILAKKYFTNIDYILGEVKDLPKVFTEFDFSNYDQIFLCDLPLSPSTIEVLNKRNDITSKLKHFDHHISYQGDIPFYVNAHALLNERKTCGTELFYDYLLSLDNKLEKDFYKTLVEATREQDTWDFGIESYNAKLLASVHAMMGSVPYIDLITSLDDSAEFKLPKLFDDLYQADLEKQKHYIEFVNKNLLITKFKDYTIGVTISEQYRSIIGDEICKLRPELDFVFIINYSRNSVSLRTVREDINLNEIGKYFHHDGGGHKKAAGFILDAESIPKIKEYAEMYLENIKTEN